MIIVTGGAGFVGSNIVRSLNDKGITNIIVVDNLSKPEKHLNLNRLKIVDFIDKEDFLHRLNQFKQVETIFHQGACSDTMETNGRYMMKNNFEYSKDLLNFALTNKINFLYASSASVYGNGNNGFREELSCEYPLNVYAYSKFLFDQHVREVLKAQITSQVLGLRYFNVYGPQENHKGRMASVAFHLMTAASKGESLKLFDGSEQFRRDFIYVDDVVSVNQFFFETKKSGIYNCGSGNAQSFTDIANTLKELLPDTQIETIPFPPALTGKYQTFTQADTAALRASGYDKPFMDVQAGVKRYFELFQNTGGYLS
jgi:ADP-L-glycero-D-manno-heptose 6-epimerase